jgi:hypothetical protein
MVHLRNDQKIPTEHVASPIHREVARQAFKTGTAATVSARAALVDALSGASMIAVTDTPGNVLGR